MNGNGEKFSEQFNVQKIIQIRTRHDEFRKILIKFDLRVRVKVPILIYLKELRNSALPIILPWSLFPLIRFI